MDLLVLDGREREWQAALHGRELVGGRPRPEAGRTVPRSRLRREHDAMAARFKRR